MSRFLVKRMVLCISLSCSIGVLYSCGPSFDERQHKVVDDKVNKNMTKFRKLVEGEKFQEAHEIMISIPDSVLAKEYRKIIKDRVKK